MNPAPAFEHFPALGCRAVVGATDPEVFATVMAEVGAEVEACDLACSRFRDDSELMSLNDPARLSAKVAVSPWLAEALATALRAARETGGLVDPTIGQCLIDLGYDRSFELLAPDRPLLVRATHVPAWERVSVRKLEARVPRGVRLDLGATAKALCADRAARRASTVGRCGVLVSLGGDISVCGPPPEEGWAVRVTDSADDDPGAAAPGQTVAVRDGGLASSGTTVRRWAQDGRSRHHLIDPRTARPAAVVWRTVSVAAASCVDANIASAAAVIMGEPAREWLSGRGLHARLVRTDGTPVFTGNWPVDRAQDPAPPAATFRLSDSPQGAVA